MKLLVGQDHAVLGRVWERVWAVGADLGSITWVGTGVGSGSMQEVGE